jgi:hypothetical protein
MTGVVIASSVEAVTRRLPYPAADVHSEPRRPWIVTYGPVARSLR